MKRLIFLLLSFLISPVVSAQEENPFLKKMDFSLMRQFDQLGIGDSVEGFYPSMKSISLKSSDLSFGGSFRGQYEYFKNEDFIPQVRENGWWLQRVLLHSDFKTQNGFRIFGELAYSEVFGKQNLAPVDINELYVNQFFISYSADSWSINIGRENVRVGTGRLVDPREGPNIRRAFDKVQLDTKIGSFDVSSFYSIPVIPQQGVFDDEFLHNEEAFWGVYAGKNRNEKGLAYDIYYLGVHYNQNEYARGGGEETRHSLGARFNLASDGLNFDNEVVYQFGSFGDESISAWTVSFNVWQKLQRFNVGVKTELISGDDEEGSLNTFNPLYPRGAYFGRVARFGPANLIDIHPYVEFRTGKLSLEVDYDHFWRFSTKDGVYDVALNVLYGESDDRDIAGQYGAIINYEFNQFFVLELESSYIVINDYIKDVVDQDRNLLHAVFTAEFKF